VWTCSPHANCEIIGGEPQCFCREGFGGDGFGPTGCNILPSLTCSSDNSRTVVGLAGYWPLATDWEDKSGNGHHLYGPGNIDNNKIQAPEIVPSNLTLGDPFADGYTLFEIDGNERVDLLWVDGFDPLSTDGSYTVEFYMRMDEGSWDNGMDVMLSYWHGGEIPNVNNQPNPYGERRLVMSSGSQTSGAHRPQRSCGGGFEGRLLGSVGLCQNDGVWRHMALTVDGPNQVAKLYIDGVVQAKEEGYDFKLCPDNNCTGGGILVLGAALRKNNKSQWKFDHLHGAMTEVRFWNYARTQDSLLVTMGYRLEGLDCGVYDTGDVCSEAEANTCHNLAYCEKIDGAAQCFCEMGMIGSGIGPNGCITEAWAVRVVFEGLSPYALGWLSEPAARESTTERFKECFGSDAVQFQRGVAPFSDRNHFPYAAHSLLVNALFLDEPSDADVESLNPQPCFPEGILSATSVRKYRWVYQTTDAAEEALPTGMTVDSVRFETACADSGCWVIQVTYTTGGPGAFNSFYLPNAVGDDKLSYDFTYDSNVMNTFQPRNFPCRTHDYIKADGSVPNSLPDQVTTCCLHSAYTELDENPTDTENGFLADYRPTENFHTWFSALDEYLCPGTGFPTIIDREDYNETAANSDPFIRVDFPYASSVPHRFLDGKFHGMPVSPGVVSTTTLDPFFYQYTATIKLDEVELRRLAGQLKGTVGVEHTVDTFLGFANFRPTGRPVLDAFATQVAIHLEKTNFFSVSTHGTNDYTFLEYVNMRLISIYTQDVDFSGLDEAANRTVRTDSSGNANYVQVTFTMGAQYQPNPLSGGLIPLDSVRAGRGTFIDQTSLEHLCTMYSEGNATAGDHIGLTDHADYISIFDDMLAQPCGPKSAMG